MLFVAEMETEERNQRACKATEPEFFLQWGNRKRLRCVRVKDPRISTRLNGGVIRRKLNSGVENHRSGVTEKESSHLHHHQQQPNRLTRLFSTTITNGSSQIPLYLHLLLPFWFLWKNKTGFWFVKNDGFSVVGCLKDKLSIFFILVWLSKRKKMVFLGGVDSM